MDTNTTFSPRRSFSKPGFLSLKSIGCIALALPLMPMLASTPQAAEAPSDSTSATLTIWNLTDAAIYEVYMSPSHSCSWGVDLLGTSILPVGNSFLLYGIASGLWDVKVVDAYGRVGYWSIQFVDGHDYTLTLDGFRWQTDGDCEPGLLSATTKSEA